VFSVVWIAGGVLITACEPDDFLRYRHGLPCLGNIGFKAAGLMLVVIWSVRVHAEVTNPVVR
jgi:hypothetical protein